MKNNIFQGFSKLSYKERLKFLLKEDYISEADIKFLENGGLDSIQLGEKFIENAIGYFQVPMGVATNFMIDGKSVLVPMAVEETSIIAAASKTAKWINEKGELTTEIIGQDIIGQIQFAKISDVERFQKNIFRQKDYLVALANREVVPSLVARGGGVSDIKIRLLDRGDGFHMGVVHVHMNPCDAMGANLINQVCEFLKIYLEQFTQESVTMCILSNLVDTKITKARVIMRNMDPVAALKIEEASRFAELDPYRAATNNKGVLNGIDPILIATGNDWRAVEAGVHSYACRDGKYSSITKWRADGTTLTGELEAPLIAGTVGGVTQLHPMAKMALKILKIDRANELSRVLAAVGLTQNLGALRALTTVGIIEGHMKLHIKNLSLGAGATETEMPFVIKKLEEILSIRKRISLSNAIEALKELRSQKSFNETAKEQPH
jgi:hydroxymethylglutaryl-CoA reductase